MSLAGLPSTVAEYLDQSGLVDQRDLAEMRPDMNKPARDPGTA
ncbi:hypothetical protein AB0C98_09535 [Streptomyces sp. NPDC048558]